MEESAQAQHGKHRIVRELAAKSLRSVLKNHESRNHMIDAEIAGVEWKHNRRQTWYKTDLAPNAASREKTTKIAFATTAMALAISLANTDSTVILPPEELQIFAGESRAAEIENLVLLAYFQLICRANYI